MSVDSNRYCMTGEALVCGQESSCRTYTLIDYCCGLVNFDVPEEAMKALLAKRGVDFATEYADSDEKTRKLVEADLYTWIALGVSKRTAVTDSDNGWSHSEGGYSLTEEDKKRLLGMANAIYEEYGEPTVGKTKIRIHSLGVMRANRTFAGENLPHIG